MFKYLIKLIVELAAFPLYVFSLAFPRDRKLWLFGAWEGSKYSDNTRYFYEYVSDVDRKLKAVWISKSARVTDEIRNTGRLAFRRWSLFGVYYALRAGFYFVTHESGDVNWVLSGGAKLISLTHGVPLKKIGKDANLKRVGPITKIFDNHFRGRLPAHRAPDLIFVASSSSVARFASAYGVNRDRVIDVGYSRWAPLLNRSNDGVALLGVTKLVILYAPTHRKAGRGKFPDFNNPKFLEFCNWLAEEGLLLLIRPHPATALSGLRAILDRYPNNLKLLDSVRYPDVYSILTGVDVLVTDYSSLLYDFLIMVRPIISLVPDLAEYQLEDAGLYEDYHDAVPGPVIADWGDMPKAIQLTTTDLYKEQLEVFCKPFADRADGKANQRIVDIVFNRYMLG